ncbi:MAG: hypothetical protein RMI94_11610 [Bryobacterales bacterium]|nr:hypothetical protein [Bryobacteraceae bacterium]MDW8131189.1 hypothetical protein [Bryobacterales bacterium]
MAFAAVRPELRRWLAAGTGVGIEIGARDLRLVAVRVRPSGVRVLGAAVIERFRERPAAEWGAVYAEFLKRAGISHLAANVLLPRREVVVRVLPLPGVPVREMAAAIGFQIEALHPYPEEEALWSWSRLEGGHSVLIAVTRRQTIATYAGLFAEAGVKTASFTVSAAALYSALRLYGRPPEGGFLALYEGEEGIEAYGESPARALFSAEFPAGWERAAAMAGAELRLEADGVRQLEEVLPQAKTFPSGFDLSVFAPAYAAALQAACRRLSLDLNLLPPEHRAAASRLIYAPTAVLLVLLAAAAVSLGAIRPIEDRRYLAALRAEIARLEPEARKAGELDRQIEELRARTRLLDSFRRRSKADLDLLAELTRRLEPPVWILQLEMTRESVSLAGEAEQASPLLKLLDESPMLRNSEFTMPIARVGQAEAFRIRSQREGSAP